MPQDFNEKILDQLISLDKRLDNVDKTLIKQEANLEKHILRTDIAEKNLDLLRQELVKVDSAIAPIKKHVLIVEWTLKVGGILLGATIASIGVLETVLKLLK